MPRTPAERSSCTRYALKLKAITGLRPQLFTGACMFAEIILAEVQALDSETREEYLRQRYPQFAEVRAQCEAALAREKRFDTKLTRVYPT